MRYEKRLTIGSREVSLDQPTYFIADIASSHDGELNRAKELIWLAKSAGADCAKFQHFLAKDIVSDEGFRALGDQMGHQASWERSVYEVFEAYQTPRDWTDTLVAECERAEIDFMTTPYDFAAIDRMNPHLQAYKIGSGDIGWTEFITAIAKHGKPVFLATGAADMQDVVRAVDTILSQNRQICLMQCNTNYTGSDDNFSYVNLNVLRSFARIYPDMPLGLSDHTPGHACVLGAIALGARAVEKHFTDDNTRNGPDHGFSMSPESWAEMVARTRELEAALGDSIKRVEANEEDSRVIQRRALHLRTDLPAGHRLSASDLKALRPCPDGAYEPFAQENIIGQRLTKDKSKGDVLFGEDLIS